MVKYGYSSAVSIQGPQVLHRIWNSILCPTISPGISDPIARSNLSIVEALNSPTFPQFTHTVW